MLCQRLPASWTQTSCSLRKEGRSCGSCCAVPEVLGRHELLADLLRGMLHAVGPGWHAACALAQTKALDQPEQDPACCGMLLFHYSLASGQ